MSLSAEDLHWAPGGVPILRGVTLRLPGRGVLGLVGPNGSGKSSLLRLMAGLRRGTGGAVLLDGQPMARMRRRDVARRLALVEQDAATASALSVREVVALGRPPRRGAWAPWSAADEAAVAAALARAGMQGRGDQPWATLSGGECQRVQIARALAQEPRELLLDEPTNHLDIRHQLELLRLLPHLGARVVVALHDLNQAAAFCDEIAVMQDGRLVAQGRPAQVLDAGLIRDVFGVEARIERSGAGLRIAFF
ncbi:ABC transporter ATP-binding protein [Mangrovicoccus algicola]|uniref:ABC transporter ATP-binding protein n=1 Tax=Mangrovicoccus algicola TaxID=2771008 RepID=A0A8J6YW37_9RHOB|nr:ABC transporter ATP-binding protein [Mangrovicoccus algicola]MBE3637294.1 ABC transporter ATP-binding protein [Mangrovicoccus algicola]